MKPILIPLHQSFGLHQADEDYFDTLVPEFWSLITRMKPILILLHQGYGLHLSSNDHIVPTSPGFGHDTASKDMIELHPYPTICFIFRKSKLTDKMGRVTRIFCRNN
jgi:hypothetical protein